MLRLVVFLTLLASCAHKRETLTSPAVFQTTSGVESVQNMDESYYENVLFMFSVSLEYQGYYAKALEGYQFLQEKYPNDQFLRKKIKFIECALSSNLC